MLLSEWKLADAQKEWKAEGIAIGEARGIKKLLALLKKGVSLKDAKEQLKL